MKTYSVQPKPRLWLAFALLASTVAAPAAITTFSYTQTDNVTGAGTIAAPAPTNLGGVTITWSATAMPAASVRDPAGAGAAGAVGGWDAEEGNNGDRKSTRLNSSHKPISYAVFCLKKKRRKKKKKILLHNPTTQST